MTLEQMQLVRFTLAHVTIDSGGVGRSFYRHLFEIAPDLRARFKGDIEAESAKLKEVLTLAFGSLTDMRFLILTLERLAQRGVANELSEQHCRAIGKSLLWAIEQRIGPGFTPQVRDAWIAFLTVVVTILRPTAMPGRIRAA